MCFFKSSYYKSNEKKDEQKTEVNLRKFEKLTL